MWVGTAPREKNPTMPMPVAEATIAPNPSFLFITGLPGTTVAVSMLMENSSCQGGGAAGCRAVERRRPTARA